MQYSAPEPRSPQAQNPAASDRGWEIRIPSSWAGHRLDQALAGLLPQFSRTNLQRWIDAGRVRCNGAACRRRDRLRGGESVWIEPQMEPVGTCQPQAIPLDLVFEDEELLVVNKPAGLVVHPGSGNPDGTLQNALLHHAPELDRLPRSGIVHRLDKDTSGLLVVAKTPFAHRALVAQLQRRQVHREYRALVRGVLLGGGTLDAPIGRHPRHRTRMAVVPNGRPALTHYRVLERFSAHSLLQVRLETGRTHQIRVHLAHLRYPLVGDPCYGGRPRPPKSLTPELAAALQAFPRQALHALRLGLIHPRTQQPMQWEVPLAADFAELLGLLRRTARGMD